MNLELFSNFPIKKEKKKTKQARKPERKKKQKEKKKKKISFFQLPPSVSSVTSPDYQWSHPNWRFHQTCPEASFPAPIRKLAGETFFVKDRLAACVAKAACRQIEDNPANSDSWTVSVGQLYDRGYTKSVVNAYSSCTSQGRPRRPARRGVPVGCLALSIWANRPGWAYHN